MKKERVEENHSKLTYHSKKSWYIKQKIWWPKHEMAGHLYWVKRGVASRGSRGQSVYKEVTQFRSNTGSDKQQQKENLRVVCCVFREKKRKCEHCIQPDKMK